MSREISATSTRRYELRKRAQTMATTRRRITEAAVHLHGTIGPARTSITAVAQQAGVQRQTVYRHFPTEKDLFAACSAHYFAEHPAPEIDTWRAISDPAQRVTHALLELYAYFEQTETMFVNVFRDEELVPTVGPTLAPFRAFLDEAGRVLESGWGARGRRRRMVAAAARHVVDFQTWRSLVRDGGVSRSQAVELAAAMVAHASRVR
jgi:AcrR family transcriptional regulator